MALFYVLLMAHFVADFVAQSDWMAVNKSKRWDALAWHVAAYGGVVFGVVAASVGMDAIPNMGAPNFFRWLALNAMAHFIQDAITSRHPTLSREH